MNLGPVGVLVALFAIFALLDARRRVARSILVPALSLAAVAVAAVAFWYARSAPLFDFAAFYCGGHALIAHVDPYLASSLRACEAGALGSIDSVFPAPQPGYDLALFALFALLPFPVADFAWVILLAAALIVSTRALASLTGLPLTAVFAALALPVAYISVELGQLAPVLLMLVCLCAQAVRRHAGILAGFTAGATLIEPHVGLPVAIAVAIALPVSRISLAATCAALGIVSLATLGVGGNIAYFVHALPLHALAESANAGQYSLTMLAHWFGAGDALADRLGAIQYLAMVVAGVWLGLRAARTADEPSLTVVVPVAAVLLGGTFIHVSQIALAIPAALVLATRCERIPQACGITAAVLLSLIWDGAPFGQLYVASAAVLAILLWRLWPARDDGRRAFVTAAIVVGCLGGMAAFRFVPATPVKLAADPAAFERAVGGDAAYASAVWGRYLHTDREHAYSSPRELARKMPLWLALGLILAGSGLLMRRSDASDPGLKTATAFGGS